MKKRTRRFLLCGGFFALFVSPVYAQESFILTETRLAKELGINKKELESQIKEVSLYLKSDKSVLKRCERNPHLTPALCKFVLALETFSQNAQPVRRHKHASYGPTPDSVSPRNFSVAQKADPSKLLTVMRPLSYSAVLSWFPHLLKHQGCPQNLLVASLRYYEIGLPSEKAQTNLEVGYRRVQKCLNESEAHYEVTHQRMGLLRLMWGDYTGAQQSLKLALRSESPQAKDKTLFWLGYIEKKPNIQKIYWEHLIEEFPLSFHALSASNIMGVDLYEKFLKKPLLIPQRRASDEIAQLGIQWLEALYMHEENKLSVSLSYRLTRIFQKRYSPANLAYIAALADKYALPGEAMQLGSFIANRNPAVLNSQTLRFIYPRPFEQSFRRVAHKIDPLLTLSVAKQESAFNPYARSPANAKGLLQILPSTAESYAPRSQKHLYNVDTSIELGGKILDDLIKRLGKVEHALAAYNAGFSRVEDWKKRYVTHEALLFIDLIPYSETRDYVPSVLRNHYWYTSLYRNSLQSSM